MCGVGVVVDVACMPLNFCLRLGAFQQLHFFQLFGKCHGGGYGPATTDPVVPVGFGFGTL